MNKNFEVNCTYFRLKIDQFWDLGFQLGIIPIYFHKHTEDRPFHYHFILDFFFWFVDIRIGKDY